MRCATTNHDSSLKPTLYQQPQYADSLSSQSTTTSSGSDWSDASSQSSFESVASSSWSLRSSSSIDSICAAARTDSSCDPLARQPLPSVAAVTAAAAASDVVPPELRQNPRRTNSGLTSRTGCPPKLVHQHDRKVNFVDNLVDAAALLVEAIWPLSSAVCRNEINNKSVLPLRTFIQETLKRSRTSYSTLQVTMYYLILIKDHVPQLDFTMEQPRDHQATRALQCGRRVFLAALILASKYLQDRNYSARAWSKISGLHTQEINQNETAFLHAVSWNLHITNTVWKRWTRILLDFRPPSTPPSPGGISMMPSSPQISAWKKAMLQLDSDLLNVEPLRNYTHASSPIARETSPVLALETQELPLTPVVLEPSPVTVHTPGRLVPALGLLPTPRLTPQPSGFSTPAASTVPQFLGKGSSMGLAMNHASAVSATQFLDCWNGTAIAPSPQNQIPTRRPSLSTFSTASSPESMISDISRTSRSSSISSSASLGSATSNARLAVPSRFRAAKLRAERPSLKPLIISSVPEDYEHCLSSSPEPYTGIAGKLGDAYLETPLGRRESELEAMVGESVNDAARTLHELQQWGCASAKTGSIARTGSKRGRSDSLESSLQENVRDILNTNVEGVERWPETLVRSKSFAERRLQLPAPLLTRRGSKRLCCSTEASQDLRGEYMLPSLTGGLGRSGMWAGILHD
ncbi:Cyclin [Scedosporium apiospermum]|uniref:Cyclin n=1 Tax=Pseudallescheria apiosperma TaxID=563466 RepID=A0A084FW71_PSEDA|nr:Cyclin [Scedosporium apiospermum]KEZ39333.1 Cyclin [Scedosporium apiospermum]